MLQTKAVCTKKQDKESYKDSSGGWGWEVCGFTASILNCITLRDGSGGGGGSSVCFAGTRLQPFGQGIRRRWCVAWRVKWEGGEACGWQDGALVEEAQAECESISRVTLSPE